ncbi:MAG: hypothetical protein ACLQVL_16595 [Terriglobia bacterium]
MCFALYGGTIKPLPRKAWRSDARDLSVTSLTERENPIRAHFSKPEIQHIGSTSGCGCDFPHVMFQNGAWPWYDDGEADAERDASDRHNREALAALLRASGEQTFELYGVWNGDFDFATPPQEREEISLTTLTGPTFRFKEGGFYVVTG